jgi:hypothetical protein
MPAPHPTKSPSEQLVDQLNITYRTNLTSSQVVFGRPVQISNDLSGNARVVVSSSPGEPYEFTTTLYFSRLSLQRLFQFHSVVFSGDFTHTHQLLDSLSERLGFQVSENDIVGHTIDVGAGYPVNVLLVADLDSLRLYGQIQITLSGP